MDKKKLILIIATPLLILLLVFLFLIKPGSGTDKEKVKDTDDPTSQTSRVAGDTTYKSTDVASEYEKLLQEQKLQKELKENAKTEDTKSNSQTEPQKEVAVKEATSKTKTSEKDEDTEKDEDKSNGYIDDYKIVTEGGIKYRVYPNGVRVPDANFKEEKSSKQVDKKKLKENSSDLMDKENEPGFMELGTPLEEMPKSYTAPNKYSKIVAKYFKGSDYKISPTNIKNHKTVRVFDDAHKENVIPLLDFRDLTGDKDNTYRYKLTLSAVYLEDSKSLEKILKDFDIPKDSKKVINHIKQAKNNKVNYDNFDDDYVVDLAGKGGVFIAWNAKK